MGPLADFCCLSEKCQQDGAAPTYYDLPITAKRCPVCGSKRFKRLYDKAPGLIRSGGRHLQHVIDVAGADALGAKQEKTDARLKALKERAPALAVPMSRLNATLAGFGAQLTDSIKEGSRPTATSHPLLSRVRGLAPTVAADGMSMRDREHKIVGGKIVKS